MEKYNEMYELTSRAESLLRILHNDDTLSVVYVALCDYNIDRFDTWTQQRFGLLTGEEYIFIYRANDDGPIEYLYAVNVTADSTLTAGAELFALLSRKF